MDQQKKKKKKNITTAMLQAEGIPGGNAWRDYIWQLLSYRCDAARKPSLSDYLPTAKQAFSKAGIPRTCGRTLEMKTSGSCP